MTPQQSLAALCQIIDAALKHCQPQTRALLTSAAQQHLNTLSKALATADLAVPPTDGEGTGHAAG
jgi:hypothetical protein